MGLDNEMDDNSAFLRERKTPGGQQQSADKTLGSHAEIWSVFDQVAADLRQSDRSKIYVQTAIDFYGIDLPQHGRDAEQACGPFATKQRG